MMCNQTMEIIQTQINVNKDFNLRGATSLLHVNVIYIVHSINRLRHRNCGTSFQETLKFLCVKIRGFNASWLYMLPYASWLYDAWKVEVLTRLDYMLPWLHPCLQIRCGIARSSAQNVCAFSKKWAHAISLGETEKKQFPHEFRLKFQLYLNF